MKVTEDITKNLNIVLSNDMILDAHLTKDSENKSTYVIMSYSDEDIVELKPEDLDELIEGLQIIQKGIKEYAKV